MQNALLSCIPPLPLHPDVYKFALAQLADGAQLMDIQARNRDMLKSGEYGEILKNGHDWKH